MSGLDSPTTISLLPTPTFVPSAQMHLTPSLEEADAPIQSTRTATVQFTQTAAIIPSVTQKPLSSPTSGPSPTPIPTATTTFALLEGPLLAFRVQNDESYLLLFDVNTLTFREIRKSFLEYAFGLNWLDNGCHLYVRGHVMDLQGNIIEQVADFEDVNEPFKVFRLSPDRNWGLNEVYKGTYERESIEHRSLEILSRTDRDIQILLAPNGGAYAYNWSPNGDWLAFSDYDENHILQVYRAAPDGQTIQQLTFHDEDPGVINLIVWSPDGQHVAYAASTLLPYQFQQGNEGWVGLITLPNLQIKRIIPSQFAYTEEMWWSQDSKRIVIIGESLAPQDDPLYGTQIHWADGETGAISNSFHWAQAPFGYFDLPSPVGNIDTIFFSSEDGYYLLDGNTNRYERILDVIETDGLIRDFAPLPFEFPGEANCPSGN
jgi:WD40 repeat protein